MVAPWDRFSLRAALWYQGEANCVESLQNHTLIPDPEGYYAAMMASMIADWRAKKGIGDFTFIAMQLPPSVAPGTPYENQTETKRTIIRAAQATILPQYHGKTDISGVAVGIDLGGKSAWGYDHPPNKNEMSRRLALQLNHAGYAQQSPPWTGPVLKEARREANRIELGFEEQSAYGMLLRDVKGVNPDGTRNDCTLCCAKAPPFEVTTDGGKHWTSITEANTQIQGTTVTLKGLAINDGASGVGVRYAWRDFVECVLYNNESLPLAPFVHMISDMASVDPLVEDSSTHQAAAARSGKLQRPPMGFNSWNFYHCNIDENTVKAVMDTIADGPLKAVGYEYVNIDDCWQVERLANGTIQPDPVRFPSGIQELSDYAHRKGLKFGVYTAQGSRTCQSRPGAYQHEELDAATYCDWGLDYLKIDLCGGAQWPRLNESWIRFKTGFDKCYQDTGREVCQQLHLWMQTNLIISRPKYHPNSHVPNGRWLLRSSTAGPEMNAVNGLLEWPISGEPPPMCKRPGPPS